MAALKIGSWPGRGGVRNPFIEIFMDALAEAGAEPVSVNSFYDCIPGSLDALVFHWPQFMLRGGALRRAATAQRIVALIDRHRRAGTRVIWLLHDLDPHDMRAGPETLVWRWFVGRLARRLDAFLTLSPGTRTAIAAQPRFAGLTSDWAWHPHYPGAAVSPEDRRAVREDLGFGPEDRVVGCLGEVLRYKGLDELMQVFLGQGEPRLKLLMGGPPVAADLVERLHAMGDADPRVRFVFERLPDAAYRRLVGACDLCVFSYRKYTHSGAMVYALSAGRRILTPSTPFADSLAAALGRDWVETHEQPLTGDRLLRAAFAPEPAALPDLGAFAPDRLATKILALARKEPPGAG